MTSGNLVNELLLINKMVRCLKVVNELGKVLSLLLYALNVRSEFKSSNLAGRKSRIWFPETFKCSKLGINRIDKGNAL